MSVVDEMVPCATPSTWLAVGVALVTFDWSFSPGLVSLSPEHSEINLVTGLHLPW